MLYCILNGQGSGHQAGPLLSDPAVRLTFVARQEVHF